MKKTTKIVTLLSLSVCFMLVITGCAGSKKHVEELHFGILPAESAIPIILAYENGYFEDHNLTVSIETFASPNDRNVAVQSGNLQATIGDVMTTATFQDHGLSYIITSDIIEDFKILSSPNSGITTMAELADKKISLVPNFILEYIMDQFAKQEGFTYEVVEIASFSARAEALLQNDIDGVVYTEPTAGMLVAGGAHLLGSSKEAGIKGGTILFSADMVSNYPEDIKAFYKAYNQAIDYMNATDASEYAELLTNYQFPESIEPYMQSQKGSFSYASTIDETRFDDIISWTLNKGQIGTSFTYDELTDFTFLP